MSNFQVGLEGEMSWCSALLKVHVLAVLNWKVKTWKALKSIHDFKKFSSGDFQREKDRKESLST